jgi:hypothetical protein
MSTGPALTNCKPPKSWSFAASAIMRITFPMVLVAEHDFGDWTRYLPRNPGAT